MTEASFAVLRICVAFATATRNDALVEEIDFKADLLNQGPEAGMGLDCTAEDFVHTVMPMIKHTAALTGHEALATALPTIRGFDHVVIAPTDPMRLWLSRPDAELKPQSRAKLYVALTRARRSVAVAMDWGDTPLPAGFALYEREVLA